MDPDTVQRLVALEDVDMKAWQETIMPEGTKCMILVLISVAPKFQSRGIGSTLLK
jgi:hypothetical protein